MTTNFKFPRHIDYGIALAVLFLGGLMTLTGIYTLHSHQLSVQSATNVILFSVLVMYTGMAMAILSFSNGNKWACMFAAALEVAVVYIVCSAMV